MKKKKNKVPHLLCFIFGYSLLSLIFLLVIALKISIEILFTNIPIGVSFLIVSYLVGYFIHSTAD